MARVFHITEELMREDCEGRTSVVDIFNIYIDEGRVEEFAKTNPNDFYYVDHIIEEIRNGRTFISVSKKYSFSDTPNCWENLKPIGSVDGREIIEVTVEINY